MIDKLNGINVQTFTGDKKTAKKELPVRSNTPEKKQVMVISHKGAEALRNYAMAAIAALGLTATASMMQSCSPDIDLETSLENQLYYSEKELEPETLVVYLPGDTICDTIYIEKPAETVYIESDYESAAADSLIAHCKNLGFEFDGEGSIPVRLNVFDRWNTTNHDLVLDGKASSEEKMVFIDEAQDYSKDTESPEIRYNRIEFSPDYGRGLTNHLYNSPTVGVKPSSAAAWVEAAKTCNSYAGKGIINVSEYDNDDELTTIGYLEKSTDDNDVDFFENRFTDYDEVDTYSWSEAKVTLADPKK